MKKVWCVQHREGWCATKTREAPDLDSTSVETLCDHTVILPWASELCAPTCRDCRTILNRRK